MSSVLFSGIVGETGVCKLLNQIQTKTYVKYIHNLPVKGVRSFQQVDIVLLTLYGFFCIEVKNWDCTVYVSPRSRYWQVEYPTRNLVVPSPIIQNGKFVGAVTHVLVNSATEGYAIFGDLMLKQSKEIS